MVELKLRNIGDSIGIIIPEELLAKLGLSQGDSLYAIETPDGFRLSTSDPVFEEQMAVARRIIIPAQRGGG